MDNIYFDHAATTPLKEEVYGVMQPFYADQFANPASSHLPGQKSAGALEDARDKIASFLGAKRADEVVFTAGGTESDNLALKGAAMAKIDQGKHIITSAIEHHAVLKSCEFLEKHLGFEITYLDVDQEGFVDFVELENSIRKDTILISIMTANNEIGTIQPIDKFAKLADENNILFHTDAVQAAGQLEINVEKSGVDLLSISAHKFNGPKGIGALYVRKGVELVPQLSGGSQEMKRRAGTVNIPAVVGMARAAELTQRDLSVKKKKLTSLRDYFIDKIFSNFDNVKLNGPQGLTRLPGNINIAFKNIDGESILFNLSLNDIAAASGSACASGSLSVSHVLNAIDLDKSYAKGALRFSLGCSNTKEEIDFTVNKLIAIINRLKDLQKN